MKNIVLLTGGGSGIGAAFAELLATYYNLHVVIIGRTSFLLEEVANRSKNIEYITADLTVDEDITNIINLLKDKKYSVRYLVNNAAILNTAKLVDATLEMSLSSLHTNVIAPLQLVNKLLTNNILSHLARVLMIDSSSRYNLQEGIGLYGISKAALYRLTQSMQEEFKNQLLVTIAYPGTVTNTRMSDEIRQSEIPALIQARNQLKSIITKNPQVAALKPIEAAEFLGWILCESNDEQFLNPQKYVNQGMQLTNTDEWDIRDCECYIDCPITNGTKLKGLLDAPNIKYTMMEN